MHAVKLVLSKDTVDRVDIGSREEIVHLVLTSIGGHAVDTSASDILLLLCLTRWLSTRRRREHGSEQRPKM